MAKEKGSYQYLVMVILLKLKIWKKTHHEFANGMSSIIYHQSIITINLQAIKSNHKPLKNGFGLKSHHTIDISFVLWNDLGAIYGSRNVWQKIVFVSLCTQLFNWDWNKKAVTTGYLNMKKCGSTLTNSNMMVPSMIIAWQKEYWWKLIQVLTTATTMCLLTHLLKRYMCWGCKHILM